MNLLQSLKDTIKYFLNNYQDGKNCNYYQITKISTFKDNGKMIVQIKTLKPGNLIGYQGQVKDDLLAYLEKNFKQSIIIKIIENNPFV